MTEKETINFPVELQKYSVGYKVIKKDTGNLIAVVGKNYHLIKHVDCIDMFEEAMRKQKISVKLLGIRMFGTLGTSMHAEYVSSSNLDIEGDRFKCSYYIRNSYDGLTRLSVGFFLQRMVCKNGLYLPEKVSCVKVKHLGEHSHKAQSLLERQSQIESLFISNFDRLKRLKPLSKRVIVNKDEYSQMKPLFEKYYAQSGVTLYSDYQAYTDFVTHRTSHSKQENYNKAIIKEFFLSEHKN